jgi:hypothetical protein
MLDADKCGHTPGMKLLKMAETSVQGQSLSIDFDCAINKRLKIVLGGQFKE